MRLAGIVQIILFPTESSRQMRRHHLLRISVVLLPAVAAALSMTSAAHAVQPPVPVHHSSAVPAAVATCALPAAQRNGGWMCVESADAGSAAASLPSAIAASDVHCHAGFGCWYVDNPHRAEFFSDHLSYGFGGVTLGTTDYHVLWGTGVTSYNTSNQSAMTISGDSEFIVFSGSLFNGAHGVVGTEIGRCADVDYAGGAEVPGGHRFASPTPYCELGDKRNFDHNMAAQLSFQDPEEPGYFWIYAKSPVAHTATLGGFYTFSHSDILPLNAFGSGYDS
jgi:hypothetical protein